MERKIVKTNQNNNDNTYDTVNDYAYKEGGNFCFIAYQIDSVLFLNCNDDYLAL